MKNINLAISLLGLMHLAFRYTVLHTKSQMDNRYSKSNNIVHRYIVGMKNRFVVTF